MPSLRAPLQKEGYCSSDVMLADMTSSHVSTLTLMGLSNFWIIHMLSAHTCAHCTAIERRWTTRSVPLPRPAVSLRAGTRTPWVACWVDIRPGRAPPRVATARPIIHAFFSPLASLTDRFAVHHVGQAAGGDHPDSAGGRVGGQTGGREGPERYARRPSLLSS